MITTLQIEGFRNIKKTSLTFAEGVNLFYGQNGAGKTNVLEALGLFSLAKSCRSAKENELVNFDRELAEVIAGIDDQKKKLKSR
jgi:DNA replication and repair protein RecF